MIIQCPACTTKYNKDLPPEGQTVRCAKCGAVWRAMPITAHGPAVADRGGVNDESETAESNALDRQEAGGGSRPEHPALNSQPGDDGDPFGEPVFNGGESELQSGSELFQRPARDAGFTNGDENPGWPSQGEGQDKDGEQAEGGDEGKVRWFGFRRKNGARSNSGDDAGLERPAASGAETIPFPRANPAAAYLSPERSDLNSLDEARAAVRSVFDSLGDQRPAGRTFNVPVVSQADPEQYSPGTIGPDLHSGVEHEPSENEWLNARSAEERGFETGLEQTSLNGGDRPAVEASSQWGKGWDASPVAEEDDPDAELRSALRAHFPGRDHAGGNPQTVASQYAQQTGMAGLEGSEPGETEPAWAPPPAMLRNRPDSQPPEPEDAFSEISEGDRSFDPRLFREIEEARELTRHARRRGGTGGLALAAAWGLFLCIAAGLVVGFAGFRDITAGALPGLAPLYRAIGMPVTDQPLIFEGVQYEWTTPDNKPALNIKGAVYNRAQRGVKVPDFVITIKDSDPALDREYSAKLQVQGSKIGPEEHAEFEIELLSPNPSITAVELELRSVR
jgi:predicted Zn finger-like uncharacterized protein